MPSALVLAAGKGTRLAPLSSLLPKPLVPVGDEPALAAVLRRIGSLGASPIVVNAHHHGAALGAFVDGFVDGQAPKAVVSYEDALLGTAGALRRAAAFLGPGPVLVWNGDIVLDPWRTGLEPELDVTLDSRDAAGVLFVVPRPVAEGTVGVDARGGVVRLRGERFGAEVAGADFVGVSVLGEELRRRAPEVGCLVKDVLLPALGEGARVMTRPLGGFLDIGSLSAYLEANEAWLRRRGLGFYVGPGAAVDARVALDTTIIGAGAQVTGQGVLERVVVWPGARAVAPLSNAIVTAEGVVTVPQSRAP